jgi:hypothetical protein
VPPKYEWIPSGVKPSAKRPQMVLTCKRKQLILNIILHSPVLTTYLALFNIYWPRNISIGLGNVHSLQRAIPLE